MQSFEEFYENYPDLAFIKTRREVKCREDLTDDNLIIEDDTPPLIHGRTELIPLCESLYPLVFKEATAMEAGLYAVDLCEKQGWDVKPAVINEIFKNLQEAFENEGNNQ